MITSTSRYAAALSMTVSGFIVLLYSAMPASAASFGLISTCSFAMNQWTCSFPILSSDYNAEINYVTAQCTSSASSSFNLQQLEVSAIPPNESSPVLYYVAGNHGSAVSSVANIANAGAIVAIHVKLKTAPDVSIELAPATAGTTCTASISGTF